MQPRPQSTTPTKYVCASRGACLTRSGLQRGRGTPRRPNGHGRRCYAAWRPRVFDLAMRRCRRATSARRPRPREIEARYSKVPKRANSAASAHQATP